MVVIKRVLSVHIPSQEIKHAKIDALLTLVARVMKRLGCDDLKKRSLYVKTLPPHVKQSLCTPKRHLRSRAGSPLAEKVPPHVENVRPHAELALCTWRTYVRIACGNGCRAVNCTSRLPYNRAYCRLPWSLTDS